MTITEYLSDSIVCNWEIKNHTSSNVVSVVYFLPEKGAAKMDKYYEGLKDIIKNIPNVLNNFKLRIYYDNSTEKQVNELVKDNQNIELFKYDIPALQNENGYHHGVIGTLLRFLPLYDNNIHRAEKVIVFDIDNSLLNWYSKLVDYFDKNKIKFGYRTRGCYGIRQRLLCTGTKYYPIIASFIYQSIKLPYNLFSDFLEEVFTDKDIKNKTKLIKNCGLNNEYSYGIDEIYINKYHLMYFYKNKIEIYPILFNHIDIQVGIKDYIYLLSNIKEFNIFIDFLNKLFNIFNIKYDLSQLNKQNDIESLKEQLKNILNDNKEINKKKIEYTLKINKKRELYKLLLDTLKSNHQLPEIKLLIKCLLINIQLELNKINIFKIQTEYKNKPIIKKSSQIKLRY